MYQHTAGCCRHRYRSRLSAEGLHVLGLHGAFYTDRLVVGGLHAALPEHGVCFVIPTNKNCQETTQLGRH